LSGGGDGNLHRSRALAGCQCQGCRAVRERCRLAVAARRARNGRSEEAPVDWSDVAHVMVGAGVRRRRPTS
jgi:hypothetical protein